MCSKKDALFLPLTPRVWAKHGQKWGFRCACAKSKKKTLFIPKGILFSNTIFSILYIVCSNNIFKLEYFDDFTFGILKLSNKNLKSGYLCGLK
jgi:hypothetical protein